MNLISSICVLVFFFLPQEDVSGFLALNRDSAMFWTCGQMYQYKTDANTSGFQRIANVFVSPCKNRASNITEHLSLVFPECVVYMLLAV